MKRILNWVPYIAVWSVLIAGCGLSKSRVSGLGGAEPSTFRVRTVAAKELPKFPGYLTLAMVESSSLPGRLISTSPLMPIGQFRAQIKTLQHLPQYENRRLIKPTETLEWVDPNPAIAAYLVETEKSKAALLALDTPAIRDFFSSEKKQEILYGVPLHRRGASFVEKIGELSFVNIEVNCDEFEWCVVQQRGPWVLPENQHTHMSLDDFLKSFPKFTAKEYVPPHYRKMEVVNSKNYTKLEVLLTPERGSTLQKRIEIQ